MNWDAIGAIGEIVGAAAVVMSVFYLGMQIRVQNRETRLSAMHEISTAFREAYSVFNGGETADIFVRGNNDFQSLSDAEKVRLMAMINPLLKVLEEAFWQHKQGRLDEELWYPMTRMFSFFLSAGTFQQVWRQRRGHYNDSFQEFVEGLEQTKYEIK